MNLSLKEKLRQLCFEVGWDTRCRNADCARTVRRAVAELSSDEKPTLLDVGCGQFGMGALLTELHVLGIDLDPPALTRPGFTFRQGDITSLPVADRAFPIVTCIDVLEHLPPPARTLALKELLRVTQKYLIIACPYGTLAETCDARFMRDCVTHGANVPTWVIEHQSHRYPDASSIAVEMEKLSRASGRRTEISVSYSEPIAIARLIRWAAARSRYYYWLTNLAFGLLYPLLRQSKSGGSYRMIACVRTVGESS